MSPKYVRGRFGAVSDDAGEVHGATLLEVNIWTAQNCCFRFCNQPQCLKINQNVAFEFSNFGIFHQKVTCLVSLFDSKLLLFKNSPKWTIFGIFNELLSTQNVNVARFARNVAKRLQFIFQ